MKYLIIIMLLMFGCEQSESTFPQPHHVYNGKFIFADTLTIIYVNENEDEWTFNFAPKEKVKSDSTYIIQYGSIQLALDEAQIRLGRKKNKEE